MSNIDLYLEQRTQLIREDRALRVDATKLEQLTPAETQAEHIVRKIRKEENISVWGGEHDDIPHPFPGMEFLTARSLIVQTKIFNILSKASIFHIQQGVL
jgi:adenosine deaminase CECR1